jgi:hypothetical protein
MHEVFSPGNLVRIKDYMFEDGTTRDKYMFVLFSDNAQAYVISSLTTSQKKFDLQATKIGCYNHPMLSTYFHFPGEAVFGLEDYFFDKDTYVLFSANVRKIDAQTIDGYLESKDPFAITRITTLRGSELKNLLSCVILSKFTPNDLKLELTVFRDSFKG